MLTSKQDSNNENQILCIQQPISSDLEALVLQSTLNTTSPPITIFPHNGLISLASLEVIEKDDPHLLLVTPITSSQQAVLETPLEARSVDYVHNSTQEAEKSPQVKLQEATSLPKTQQECFICPICYTSYPDLSLSTTLACGDRFCRECLELYIKTKIDTFQLIDIRCPKDGCLFLLTEKELVDILDQPTFDKYHTLLEIKLKTKDASIHYCSQPGCARQLKLDPAKEFTTCECGTLICNKCFWPKHTGKSCSQVLKDKNEVYNQNKNLKMCIICKSAVERWTGCPHIRCPVCDYEWCWDCGREYGPGHGRKCRQVWAPEPPAAFAGKQKTNVLKQFVSATLLLGEMIFFYLVAMIGVLVVWPFVSCFYFGNKDKKLRWLKLLIGFLGGLLSWPLAVIVLPGLLILEEYCTCCRKRRRWLRGNVELYGFGKSKKEEEEAEEGENKKEIKLEGTGKVKESEVVDLEAGRNI